MQQTVPAEPTDSRTPRIRAKIVSGAEQGKEFVFDRSFRIGRDPRCEVCVTETCVSRVHAEVILADSRWSLRDLKSSNGMYAAGARITRIDLAKGASLALGRSGPVLNLEIEQPAPVLQEAPLTWQFRFTTESIKSSGLSVGAFHKRSCRPPSMPILSTVVCR